MYLAGPSCIPPPPTQGPDAPIRTSCASCRALMPPRSAGPMAQPCSSSGCGLLRVHCGQSLPTVQHGHDCLRPGATGATCCGNGPVQLGMTQGHASSGNTEAIWTVTQDLVPLSGTVCHTGPGLASMELAQANGAWGPWRQDPIWHGTWSL